PAHDCRVHVQSVLAEQLSNSRLIPIQEKSEISVDQHGTIIEVERMIVQQTSTMTLYRINSSKRFNPTSQDVKGDVHSKSERIR
ncbi:MAG: hypothetical protein ACRDDF_00085, partial [Aeromonas sp.]